MRKALYILGLLDDEDIVWLVTHGEKKRVSTGEIIITEGIPSAALFVVADGEFEVIAGPHGGKTLAYLGSGEIVGELSFLDSRPPTATVKARKESTVLSVQRDKIAAHIAEDDGFSSRFYHALGVFLAVRMRSMIVGVEYTGDNNLNENTEYTDEIEDSVLDRLDMAGARFNWIVNRLQEM